MTQTAQNSRWLVGVMAIFGLSAVLAAGVGHRRIERSVFGEPPRVYDSWTLFGFGSPTYESFVNDGRGGSVTVEAWSCLGWFEYYGFQSVDER